MFFKKQKQINPEIQKIFNEIGYDLNPKQLYMEKQKLNESKINYNQILKDMILEINNLIPKQIENNESNIIYTPFPYRGKALYGHASDLYQEEIANLTENKRSSLIIDLLNDIKNYYTLLECKSKIDFSYYVGHYIEISFK